MKLIMILVCFALQWGGTTESTVNEENCSLVVFSEISKNDQEISLDYDSLCELEYLVLEIFDQWGNHIYGLNQEGIEWGGDKITLTPTHLSENTKAVEGTYYYIAQYKFKGDKETQKLSGSVFNPET